MQAATSHPTSAALLSPPLHNVVVHVATQLLPKCRRRRLLVAPEKSNGGGGRSGRGVRAFDGGVRVCVCCSRRRGVAAQQQLPRTGTAVRCRRKQNEDYALPIHVMCSTMRGTSHIKAFSEIIEFIIVRVCAVEYRTPKTIIKKKNIKKTPLSQCRSLYSTFHSCCCGDEDRLLCARDCSLVDSRPR